MLYKSGNLKIFLFPRSSAATRTSSSSSGLRMVQRITYRRRLSYNTRSNRRKIVRTPGGRLTFQYLKKRPSVPKCPMTGLKLKGITPSRP